MSQSVGPSYFYEDEVYRVSKSGDVEFGMVTENWEMYSSSDEEDMHADKVLPGQVCVSWFPKGKEEVLPEAKVKLSARSLMPGDVVRRLIAGKDTQRGYCRSVKVRAAVQIIGTKKVIPNISASDLIPVQKLTPEVAVYLDTWIGVIRDMKYRLHLKLADNSSCEVDSTFILEHFEDVRRGYDSFNSSEVFYPGQKLRGPMRFLKNADWSYCSDDMKRAKDRKYVTVVVTDVVPSLMVVQWQWQTPECPLEAPPENIEWQKNPPPDTVKGDTLKRVKTLNLFESCTVQLGDVSYYMPKTGDIFIEKVAWRKTLPSNSSSETVCVTASPAKNSTEKLKGKNNSVQKKQPANTTEAPSEEGAPITVGEGGDSCSDPALLAEELMETLESGVVAPDAEKNNNNLPRANSGTTFKRTLPRLSTKALRKKKLKKTRPPSVPPPSIIQSLATRVVVETVHTNALVDVVWQDGTYEEGISSVELYPIHHLDDHEFFPGDFVIRADASDPRTYGVIQKMDHAERVAVVKWFEAKRVGGNGNVRIRYQRPSRLPFSTGNNRHPRCQSCRYLDKMMGTKFFDVDDLKNWYKGKEGVSSKSRRMIEQISRMFDIPADGKTALRRLSVGSDYQLSLSPSETRLISSSSSHSSIPSAAAAAAKDESAPPSESTPTDATASASGEDGNTANHSNFLSYELCSIILNKLLKVHGEYQKRFGSGFIVSEEATLSQTFLEDGQRVEGVGSSPAQEKGGEEASSSASGGGSNPSGPPLRRSFMRIGGGVDGQKSGIMKELFSRLFKGDCVTVNGGGTSSDTANVATPSPSSTATTDAAAKAENEVEAAEATSESVPVLSEDTGVAESDNNANVCIEGDADGPQNNFIVIEAVPDTHRYRLTTLQPQNQKSFVRQVQKEVSLMRNSLPDGIYVKTFDERMDLFSVMIFGPEKTPYEDGVFFFDIQLPPNYPNSPPLVHYVSFCTDRLNPNLYEEGKVCVSLLGTWSGKGTEVWTSTSSILQLLVSIQGLILVPEPYYNEAGYEKQRGSQQGMENSRMYNEMVLIKLVQSMSRMLVNPPAAWDKEAVAHIQKYGPRMVERYKKWLAASEQQALDKQPPGSLPDFPLLPVSKGFSITLKKTLDNFAKLCATKQPSTTSNCTSSSTSNESPTPNP